MKLNINSLEQGKKIVGEKEEVKFDKDFKKNNSSFLGIKNLTCWYDCSCFNGIYETHFFAKGVLVLECAYTLEPIDYPISLKGEISFVTDEDLETEDMELVKTKVIDLDPYIYELILANIPFRVTKKGAKMPRGDGSIKVMTEDELKEERKSRENPAFSSLKDLDLDDKD